MFYAKVFTTKYDVLVAICDRELLGKKIRWKDFEIVVSKSFYGGEIVDENECVELMKKATIGNLMGKKIVELSIKEGFIEKKNVIVIDGVPHAQFVKL